MNTMYLYERLTFKYRDGFSSNDRWGFVGPVRVTPPRITSDGDGLDHGATYLQWATMPRGMDYAAASRAIIHTAGGSNCRHEYDCCGCVLRYVKVIRRKGRRILFRTSESFNY